MPLLLLRTFLRKTGQMFPLAPDVGGVGRPVITAKDAWVEIPREVPRNEARCAQDQMLYQLFQALIQQSSSSTS